MYVCDKVKKIDLDFLDLVEYCKKYQFSTIENLKKQKVIMKIESSKVVKLVYELYVGEGDIREIVEIAGDDDPMVFIHGLSGLPQKFEEQLIGLSANDTFNFSVSPENGYGEIDEEALIDFPIEHFKIEDGEIPEGMLEIGNFIPFANEEGNKMTGKVSEVHPDYVILDFNHPLAGQTMHFMGKILSVRNATPDELSHGHVHGEGGVIH